VTPLRSHHEIPVCSAETREREGWLTLTEAARLIGVSPKTLRLGVEHGELKAEHPLAEGPWIFNRNQLDSDAVAELVARARARNHHPAGPKGPQGSLDFNMSLSTFAAASSCRNRSTSASSSFADRGVADTPVDGPSLPARSSLTQLNKLDSGIPSLRLASE